MSLNGAFLDLSKKYWLAKSNRVIYGFAQLKPVARLMSLIDAFGRPITYVRLSITDRCDLRCTYCMAEEMTFLPRQEVLTIEELALLGQTLVELGIRKIRLTGGEPLIRRGVIELAETLGRLPDLEQLCLTTNGTHLAQHAQPLRNAGVHQVNISLDSINPVNFRRLTRVGQLSTVMEGIDAAICAGFASIKLNCVALKHYNADEIPQLVDFALRKGLDISFIEEMPLGKINDHERAAEFVSGRDIREILKPFYQLTPAESHAKHSGPARYWAVKGFTNKLGFISPHSENFCSSCNRIRITATGRLLLCLGHENSLDLRKILRESPHPVIELKIAITQAMQFKPEKHQFDLQEEPQIIRFMNMTGG